MKNNKKAIGIVLTAIMLISVSVAIAPTVSATEAGDLEEIQKAIEGSGAEWQAGYTSVSGLSLEEKQQLCGLKIRESMTMKKMIVSASSVKRSRYDESASSVKRSRYDESATNEMGIASIDTTMEVPKTSSLAGYNIAVVNAGYDPGQVELQLEAWGATVDLINVPAITASLLSSYDLVWIPYAAAGAVDSGGKAAEILSYVQNGGGEILDQPGEVMTPQCLPYTWQITDIWYGDACATTILDPTHELTAGLTVDDMPDAFDRSGTVDPAYTILALSGESEPTFGCANYGNGRVIVEMDAPLGPGICDVCGDCPSLSEAMVTRMVEWVSESQPCDAFDWRDYLGGDWTTSIKDQGYCGSCWAFGSQAAMEAHIDLQKDDPTFNQDLSEQQLLSCSPGDCDGWYEDAVLNWLRDEGTVDEACFPYEADDTIPCSDHCPDWESRIWKITDWGWVAPTIPAITGHLHDAPLVTGMAVYDDFSYYDGGIYEHVWGELRGYHLVSMVGYDECEDYWICKNSWGPDWGEEGWFRIRFGQCDIENMNAYIEPPIIEPPPDDGWGVRLDATCGAGTDVAEFGLNVDATDGFDPEFDEVEPPPPPGDYQQAYFYYPENPSWCRKLSTSYIPHHFMDAVEWNSWPFQLAYSGEPSDVTITWNADDIDAVPADYWLYFVVDGEWIDMRTTPSYTFSATTGTCDFEILAIPATPYTFELYTGWNMISFPVDPLDKDPDNIFGPGYYQLVTWDPVSGSYVAVDEVETGIGYWLLVTEDRSVTVLGVQIYGYYTGLIQGWNMIGSIIVDTNVPGGTETIPPNQMHPSLYTWNVDHYDTTQDIDPGLGYWALAYNDCELHVFPAPPPPPPPSIPPDENNWGVKLDATCDVGTDVAEFGLNADATDGFDPEFDEVEPPPPPGDHQQAYFYYPGNPSWCKKLSTSYIPHHFLDAAECNSWPFQLAYSGDPSDVTITWDADDIDAVPPGYWLYFIPEVITEVMVDGEQIDMRTTPSYTFSATTGTYEFEIRAITEKPDLVIEDKWEEWVNETHYNVSYVIHNNGTAVAPACHNTTLYVDGVAIEHKHVPVDLAYCETYTDTFDTAIECTGESDTIRVCADNYDVINESNETNNCLENEWICKPDLNVTKITLNCGYLFANESNEICAKIENIGGGDAGAFNVSFNIDGFSTEVRISGLAAGANTTVCINDTTIRIAGELMTINVTADCNDEVDESDEMNNELILDTTVVNNGYKGKRYTGGSDINTWATFELKGGNLIYSLGDSYYLSSYSHPDWTEYNAGWDASELPIPGILTATIETARLFVPYTWDKSGVMPTYVAMSFNGNPQTLDAHYSDEKGWGTSYPYGMLVYDVTADFKVSGNVANLTNSYPGGDNVSMRGMLLVVVYADDSEPERTILMNEEFDLLYGGSSKCTTPEEATAYAPFGSIDTTEIEKATLITVAPGAGPNEGDLSFNTHMWYDVWNFVGIGTPTPQIGIAETDVTSYLEATDNEANFQSSADYMEASNAFLILEKKGEIPCPADYAVYQANVSDPEGRLNELRALRDEKLDDGYVTRYYDNSPALTMVLSRADSDLVKEGAQLLSRYSIPVGLHVQGMDVDERITRQDVEEALSFTDRLKREVMKNRDAIGADRTEAIIVFIDEFEGQVKASEGKTFSAALKSSIYYEGGQLRVE